MLMHWHAHHYVQAMCKLSKNRLEYMMIRLCNEEDRLSFSLCVLLFLRFVRRH